MATQIDRDQAKTKIDEFAAKGSTGAFTQIWRADVVRGFKERVDDPIKINQGNATVCPSASVLYSLAKDRPKDYVQLVSDLYDKGEAKLADWNLKPCTDLKNYALTLKDTISAVDWIPMASLRDSQNWLIDYQDTTDDGGGWDVANMLKKAGYTTVLEEWNYFFTKGRTNIDLANTYYKADYSILMLIDADILGNKTGMSILPNHWVVLASEINLINSENPYIDLTVYSWGTKIRIPPLGKMLKLNDFTDSYYGFVACKY